MHACPCGETDIDQLEPMDSGLLYCATCKHTSRPGQRTPPPPVERERKDLS